MTDRPDWTHYRARVAALTRSRPADDPELVEARRLMDEGIAIEARERRTGEMIDYVTAALRADPALTPDQLQRIATAVLAAPAADI